MSYHYGCMETNPAMPERGELMIRVDLHTHTCHSHARDTAENMYAAARAAGLAVQGFSEHSFRPAGYDYPTDEYRERLDAEFGLYLDDVARIRSTRQEGDPEVLLGLEADWLEDEPDFMRSLAASQPWDYIIGGIHFLGKWGFDYSAAEWAALTRNEKFSMYERYYGTMKAMAESRLFDIVAHPDLVKIYSVEDFRAWLSTAGAGGLIESALTAVRDAGMALEISSAGLRKPCGEIYPGPGILRMAAELGLPVTFASDSHSTDQVAWNFDRLAAYAADAGWSESAVFRQRRMELMPFQAPQSGPRAAG